MDYESISIREAVRRINDTWFLPAIQRPYDWGERSKKEQFIYKLFDSLIRRYPIGTLIVWPTKQRIAYREFLGEYDSERLEKIKDKGVWAKSNKVLIYDGQQRLQSLYSCLIYTFHSKVLCYDLLFDPETNKGSDGFKFYERNDEPNPRYLRLNELFSFDRRQQAEFEENVLTRFGKELKKKELQVVRYNLKNLWLLFVEEDIKLLASYPLKSDLTEAEVHDIFVRINTTGMVLTKSEILFSKIKRRKPDFEEGVWETCREIKRVTNGYAISPDEVLQIVFLLIKKGVRLDPDRVDESEINEFIEVWGKLRLVLRSFFCDFIYREFKINNENIINLKRPLIPLIAYFYYMKTVAGKKYRDFDTSSINNMKKYFVISQLKGWDLDSYSDNFSRIIENAVRQGVGKESTGFPYRQIINFVAEGRKREHEVVSWDFDNEDIRWFILKVLIPGKEFQYVETTEERFNPEIDHIFPRNPRAKKTNTEKYRKMVETVWNLQPVKGEVNNLKGNTPPQEFFQNHPKYLAYWDFLPNQNPRDTIWSDKQYRHFIRVRQEKMLRFARKQYGLTTT